MSLIALDLRPGPASSVPNVLCLPEACPDHGKPLFPPVIEPVLERYFSSFFMSHHRLQQNPSSQRRFLPSPTMIENAL
jgi:hypothetical protein